MHIAGGRHSQPFRLRASTRFYSLIPPRDILYVRRDLPPLLFPPLLWEDFFLEYFIFSQVLFLKIHRFFFLGKSSRFFASQRKVATLSALRLSFEAPKRLVKSLVDFPPSLRSGQRARSRFDRLQRYRSHGDRDCLCSLRSLFTFTVVMHEQHKNSSTIKNKFFFFIFGYMNLDSKSIKPFKIC